MSTHNIVFHGKQLTLFMSPLSSNTNFGPKLEGLDLEAGVEHWSC